VRRAEAENAAGRPFTVRVLTGASAGKSVDGALAAADAISFRAPYQGNPILRKKINSGEVHFVDMHLSMLPQHVALPTDVFHVGDLLLCNGPRLQLEKLRDLLGMPPDTIDTVRELGVSLFMACVGIYAGKSFVATVLNGDGLLWMGCAALITVIPIFLVGLVARGVFKVNYLTLCGVLAGSATDPPALAFANSIDPSQAQSTGYAAVYPVTMFLRILAPQIILGLLWLA
jgi:AspT/YidE/YbjL antiporter-like protein